MVNEIAELDHHNIRERIFTIRGAQIMMDYDLAEIYQVEVKRLNEQVKRNVARFPEQFRFQLTLQEVEDLKSQIVTSSTEILRSQIATLKVGSGKHRKYLPYAFTEQGVAMLSAVLRSETAIKVSIQIMDAFVGMRKLISGNAGLLQRMDRMEQKQYLTDSKLEKVFQALESAEPPQQGVFFNGQIFDAYLFVNDLLRQAKRSIVLIDNYIDDTVLMQLAKRRQGVRATVLSKTLSKRLQQDLEKHNAQYPEIEIIQFSESHDRFLIIDHKSIYHIGASLKDLGKRWFAFSKIERDSLAVMGRVEEVLGYGG